MCAAFSAVKMKHLKPYQSERITVMRKCQRKVSFPSNLTNFDEQLENLSDDDVRIQVLLRRKSTQVIIFCFLFPSCLVCLKGRWLRFQVRAPLISFLTILRVEQQQTHPLPSRLTSICTYIM